MRTPSPSALLAGVLTLGVTGCGTGVANGNAAQATIDFIRKNGFPKLAQLMPSLPPQLARIPGVQTSASGLPELPRSIAGANFGDVSGLLGEAQGLAAQGFSESRRLEATLVDLVTPAYDLLGRADLFARGDDASTTTTGADGAFLTDSSTSAAVGSLFGDLLSQARYAINTGGANGLPSYIVLGTDARADAVMINGVWADGTDFATGFAAKVRLVGLDDFAVSIAFAPAKLKGLIADWNATKCDDDVWQLAIGAKGGERNLAVTARECASTRNAVSQLALARGSDADAWTLTGAFAQSFPDADPRSLRGFLGKRQGLVMQAAAARDVTKIAAAAAVLTEADFSGPSQEKIDRFGVGAILARFFQTSYFAPKAQAAANGSVFDQYDNVAYWLCEAPVVASAVQGEVQNIGRLCGSGDVDVETILTGLTSLKNTVAASPLAPASVAKQIGDILGVLSIRNTLFVGSGGELAYKTPPDASYATLDDARRQGLPGAVGETGWLGGAQADLPRLAKADIPDTAYKALQSGLKGFLGDTCRSVARDAQQKAGKSDTSGTLCAK